MGTKFGWKDVEEDEASEPGIFGVDQSQAYIGQFCRSGLAFKNPTYGDRGKFNAKCTEVEEVSFDGEVIEKPYPCDPTVLTKMCQYSYRTGEEADAMDFFEYGCKCALDGDSGFCGSVLGTKIMKDNVTHIKTLLADFQCHTLDRNDQRAWKDQCSNSNHDLWTKAVEAKFMMNRWPYLHVERKRECIEQTFSDSPLNLSKDEAALLIAGLMGTSILLYLQVF